MTDLATYRPDLLRHCYRMLGSFADAEDLVQDVLVKALQAKDSYRGDAPLEHWLMRIATNACLNELARRARRGLPHLDGAPGSDPATLVEGEVGQWLTPALDTQLFATPQQALELRESVAIAFLALLQRLPPKQRAAVLLKDVVGWTAENIAEALELTLAAVNSALFRARETLAGKPAPSEDPPPAVLREYIRTWEERDVDGLVALLRADVTLSMPPFATWFHGKDAVAAFLRGPAFAPRWALGFRAEPVRANGRLALAFSRPTGGPTTSIQFVDVADGRVVSMLSFIRA